MKWYLSFVAVFLVLYTAAQDVHYSMFSFASASLNPALTGIFEHDHSESDYRFFTNYRNQWRSIRSPYGDQPTPFSTFSASSDLRLRSLRLLRYNAIGVGGMAYSDKSGDLNFSTTQFAWSVSFQKSIGRDHRDFFTVGFQDAAVRRSINFSNATYDSQWNGATFDPGAATGENVPTQQFYYQDMNAGLSYVHRPLAKKATPWTVGFAYFHLNRPNQSFFKGPYEISLKQKFLLHGSAKIDLANNYLLYPVFLLMHQGQANEANLTVYGGKKNVASGMQARIGVGYRFVESYKKNLRSDALMMALWLLYNQWDFGVSYDTNLSGLTRATQLKGGLEIFLIFHHQFDRPKSKYHRFRNRLPDCPDIYRE